MSMSQLDVTCDISPECFGTRQDHYLNQIYGIHRVNVTNEGIDFAWKSAAEEMMDEIHAMLYALCKDKGIVKDDSPICGQQEVSRGNQET